MSICSLFGHNDRFGSRSPWRLDYIQWRLGHGFRLPWMNCLIPRTTRDGLDEIPQKHVTVRSPTQRVTLYWPHFYSLNQPLNTVCVDEEITPCNTITLVQKYTQLFLFIDQTNWISLEGVAQLLFSLEGRLSLFYRHMRLVQNHVKCLCVCWRYYCNTMTILAILE